MPGGIAQLYVPPDRRNVAVGNERVVFTGGLGQRRQQVASHQVAHAADFFRPGPVVVHEAPPPWAN